ncbi:hypothetical protein D3C75_1292840 [compost metagenome]
MQLFGWCILKHELSNCTEGYFFSMEVVVRTFKNSQTVVDRMCCCQTTALKSKTRQQNIRLYDVLQCLSYHVAVTSYFSFCTVSKKHLIT